LNALYALKVVYALRAVYALKGLYRLQGLCGQQALERAGLSAIAKPKAFWVRK